jgi:phosphoribosylamine--glycine ligase
MKILLIGSGGREHALAWKMAQSPLCDVLYCAPGNAGIKDSAICVDIAAEDIDGLVAFAKDKAIDLVVVGPEGPLVAGVSDALRLAGIDVFGPSKAAAILEGSKGFVKDLCKDYNIPTAAYERFTEIEPAKTFAATLGLPVVIKADGLAAGKGVIIPQTREEIDATIEDMLSGNAFGAAGSSIVIEEFLDGEELSFFVLADGETALPLISAQDHKRAFDGDQGPNTGGMGAYSPARLMTSAMQDKIMTRMIKPTIAAMKDKGMPYMGVFFAGIMVVDGEPQLIEYNVRFGDPECQTLMMRMEGDLVALLQAAAQGRLVDVSDSVRWSDDVTLCVVMAANGYPGAYQKGTVIKDIEVADAMDHVKVFHAGTALNADGLLVSVGGRVLGVTARGKTVEAAREAAYKAVDTIDWPDGFCRRDIAWRAL